MENSVEDFTQANYDPLILLSNFLVYLLYRKKLMKSVSKVFGDRFS